jgi:hypothetical protein
MARVSTTPPQRSGQGQPVYAEAGTAGRLEPQPVDAEPSEEDVARAFSVYDTEGVGEIPALDLDGE